MAYTTYPYNVNFNDWVEPYNMTDSDVINGISVALETLTAVHNERFNLANWAGSSSQSVEYKFNRYMQDSAQLSLVEAGAYDVIDQYLFWILQRLSMLASRPVVIPPPPPQDIYNFIRWLGDLTIKAVQEDTGTARSVFTALDSLVGAWKNA